MSAKDDRPANGTANELPRQVREAFARDASAARELRLREELAWFRGGLRQHPYVRRLAGRRAASPWGRVRRAVQPVLLAATAAVCVVLAGVLLVGPATPTWAQVAEQLASVPFFSATVYFRDSALADSQRLELWFGRGGRVRIKMADQVLFGEKGQVVKAFDLRKRQEAAEPNRLAQHMLRILGDRESFSLETVIAAFSGGRAQDVAPLVNPEAEAGRELVVYDVQPHPGLEWCRIWALRESRLPVRVQIWEPTDGGGGEAVFSYFAEQPQGFFDPEAFAKRLTSGHPTVTTLAYGDLDDPGGKRYAPAVAQWDRAMKVVTRTLDGQPWSLGEQQGKVTLLYVWDPRSNGPGGRDRWLDWLEELYKEYGAREGFQIVTLAVTEDAETVRAAVASQHIPWLHLYEDGRGWDGELAKAIGGDYWTALYLVNREGNVRELEARMTPAIEFEMEGLSYETWSGFILQTNFQTLTAEQLRTRAGKPDRVEASQTYGSSSLADKYEDWVYVLTDKKKEQQYTIRFCVQKETGRVTGHSSSHSALEPARLELTITPDYWRREVLPRIEAKYRPESDGGDQYCVKVVAWRGESPKSGYTFGGGNGGQEEFEPGRPHVRLMLYGTYTLSVDIEYRKSHARLQQVVLRENLDLSKNSQTEIVLE